MAGNKAIYDTSMKRAHDYAWGNQWDNALREYGRALAEFPSDRTAHRNMAQCLFRLRRWSEAMVAYENLLKTDPGDLFALNRLAEIFLAIGDREHALSAYNRLADLYISNNQMHEALRALRDISRALPKEKGVHERLLDLAQEVGDRPAQVAEHLALSVISLEQGSLGAAQQYADAAASLDPDNPEVRRWGYTVRRRLAEAAGTVTFSDDPTERTDAELRAQAPALPGTGLLPVMEQKEPDEALNFIELATQAQSAQDYPKALEYYDQAVRAGAKRASVFYSAGLLNQQMGRPDFAIPYLERAAQDTEFAMSASYVIGQCYMAMRNFPKAVNAFEQALSLLNIPQLTRNEADELIELYSAAAEAHLADNNPGRASSLFTNLVNLFKERRWPHPQLPDLEAKADQLYSMSIQSKLLGISHGSNQLDPARLPASQNDATQQIGMGRPAGDEDPDGTSQLRAGTNLMNEAAPSGPLLQDEAPTTVMRAPGSSLRSITEYLRSAKEREPVTREPEPVAAEVKEEPAPAIRPIAPLPQPAPSEQFPLMSDPNLSMPPGFSGTGHIVTALPNSVLVGIEQQSLNVQRMIAEAERNFADGKLDAAVDSSMAVIRLEPTYIPIHLLIADVYLRRNKVADAITKLETVIEAYVTRSEPGNAADVCERLLRLEPDNQQLRVRYGTLLMEAGRVDEAARALLSIAESYFKAGDLQRAIEEAERLRATLPNSSDVALALGTYHMTSGDSQTALAELSSALHLDPSSNPALARLYVVLASINEPTEWDALQSILERATEDPASTRTFMEELYGALKANPSPAIYYGLAVLAERCEMPEAAADALDQGLLLSSFANTAQLEGPYGPALLLLEVLMSQFRADLAINAHDWGVAAQDYSRALQILESHGALTPTEMLPDGTCTSALKAESELQSPRPQYSFARVAEPAQLYYGLAEAHASQNNWEGALSALQALKKLMPTDHSVHTRLADIYFRQGQLGQALAELNDMLIFYQKVGDHEKTLETLGHMAKLAPNNVAVRSKLADMYFKLGMTEYGLTELNTLAELQLKAGTLKDAMRTYQRAADLHYTLGQHDRAIGIYERIVRIAPKDIDARQQLINMYIQSGKIDQAINGERALAEIFVQEGQTEEAIAALHQLLALSPEDVQGHHQLARELTILGKYGEAARLYGRLLRLEPDNDRVPILHQEMLRMAKEAAGETPGDAGSNGHPARPAPGRLTPAQARR